MSKIPEIKGIEITPKEKKAAERAERLGKQLRDNLQRRKKQARGRDSGVGKKA
jgi:hypothetical protein